MDEQLRAEGTTLRIWRPDDVAALTAVVAVSEEAFAAWLPNALRDLADVRAYLAHVRAAYEDGSGFYYAIEDDGPPLGQCSLHPRRGGGAEIGYWVRTDRTGQGLATRAVRAVAAAAFAEGHSELVIHCDEGNTRSASVARKAGFAHLETIDLDPSLPRTPAQTGREMTWTWYRSASSHDGRQRAAPPGAP